MNILFNTPIIGVGFVVIVVLAYYTYLKRMKPEKWVYLLRMRDRRAKILKIIQETDLGLTCAKSEGVIHRFIKAGPSWVLTMGTKMVTLFFAVEGTAYTGVPEGDEIQQIPVADYLKTLWPKEIYDAIPTDQKNAIETDVKGVTIKIAKIDTEELGLTSLTSDDVNDEDDKKMLGDIAGAVETSTMKSIYNNGIFMVLGALAMYLLVQRGII